MRDHVVADTTLLKRQTTDDALLCAILAQRRHVDRAKSKDSLRVKMNLISTVFATSGNCTYSPAVVYPWFFMQIASWYTSAHHHRWTRHGYC